MNTGSPMTRTRTGIESPENSSVQFTKREMHFTRSIVQKFLKNEEDAEDATQEALLVAVRHRDAFRGEAQFTTWLYRVAVTSALMHLRKQRHRPQPFTPPEGEKQEAPDIPAQTPSPEDTAAFAETMAACENVLDTMGDKYKDVFRLRFLEGYTETEVARLLKLNVGTVKTRAHRARLRVREALGLEAQAA